MSSNTLAGQAGRPSGLLGRILGRIMAWHNQPDNVWTISLLNIQPTDHVLEIGFGPGRAVQLASERAAAGLVYGIDHSETMVGAAGKRNAAAVKAGRVVLKQGDVMALPHEDGTFDKAYSINCIYFWPSPVDCLKEIRRVLKPSGVFALTVRDRRRRAYIPFSAEKLTAMLSEAGFRDIRCEQGPYPNHPILCAIGVK